jgi:hypothetical protein
MGVCPWSPCAAESAEKMRRLRVVVIIADEKIGSTID